MKWFVHLPECLGLLFLLFVPAMLLPVAAQQPMISLAYVVCALIILFYFINLWQKSPDLPTSRKPVSNPILASIIALLALLAVGPIYDAVSSFFGIGNGSDNLVNQQALASLVAAAPFLAALHIVVYAPISEEILFRGLFLRHFPRPAWLMMLISACLFASLHAMPTSWDFAPYFIMGGIFGGLYLYTRQLRYNIAVHAINNLFGYAALALQT